jgi:hypothetical protein
MANPAHRSPSEENDMNDRRFSPLRALGAIGLTLALLFLCGCRPQVSQPPPAPPSPSPAPTVCEHGEILHPELDAPAQALNYVTSHYPRPALPAKQKWTYMGQAPEGAPLLAADNWTLRMADDLSIVIANEATGFEWKGQVGVRTPPGGCGNDEYIVSERSVTQPTPGAATIAPQCTPQLVTQVCKESEFCYDDRGPAKDAVWDYFEAHYPDQGPKYGFELWPRNLVGEVTTGSGTFDVYADSDRGWTLSIRQGEPPIRFILADDAENFRWEGLATPGQSCEGCYCRVVFEPSEVSVRLPSGTRTPQCETPGFISVMQASVAQVRKVHPEQPAPDDTRGPGGGWLLYLDWATKPTRVAVVNRDTELRWEGEMAWHADEACRLQVEQFTELPPATSTPSPRAGPAPTATPSGPPDFSALHLGWVWPDGVLQVKDWFAVDGAGNAYLTDVDGRLHALLPPGEEMWSFEEGQEGMAPPVLGPDGKALYVLTLMPDTLWALGTDGKQRWDTDLKHQPITLPIVAPDGAVYVSTMGGGYRYPPGGKEPTEFSWPDHSGPESAVFDPQGRLYVREYEEVWVHSSEGKQERTCTIKNLVNYLAGWPAGGFVYTTSEGDLIAADPECKEIWRYAGGEAEPAAGWSPIAVTPDGSVYAARKNGEIVVLDSGKLRWRIPPDEQSGEPLYLLPAPGGTLYIVTAKGQVFAFDAQGKKVWTHKLPAAGAPGPPQLTPGGGLALVQGGRLWYFTPDPALSAAEPTPVPLPANMDAARDEIARYVLEQLGCNIESIVILARAGATGPSSVDTSKPIRVWWCWGGKFTERKDMQEAIAEAQKRNAEADPTGETYPVARTEFTIDVDESLQRAVVYIGWTRGPLWGEGNVYTLGRSAAGEWWVVDSQMTWIS